MKKMNSYRGHFKRRIDKQLYNGLGLPPCRTPAQSIKNIFLIQKVFYELKGFQWCLSVYLSKATPWLFIFFHFIIMFVLFVFLYSYYLCLHQVGPFYILSFNDKHSILVLYFHYHLFLHYGQTFYFYLASLSNRCSAQVTPSSHIRKEMVHHSIKNR